jgi:phosphatidylglycerophosphate synthase
MFDALLRPLIDPPLNGIGKALARIGLTANQLTIVAVMVGLANAAALSYGNTALAIGLILLNRLLDGLDGAVARVRGPSDLGGYLDIVGDFIFYTGVPVGFAIADPANAVAAAVLLATFTVTGVSFLAYAAVAAKQGRETTAHGRKSFFYSTGIAEGTETIVVFLAMCLWPGAFTTIAYIYAGLCVLTVLQRSILAWRDFRSGA